MLNCKALTRMRHYRSFDSVQFTSTLSVMQRLLKKCFFTKFFLEAHQMDQKIQILKKYVFIFYFQALEDVHLKDRPVLQDVLYYMDRIFTVVFFLEMCVKWLALGFVKYFTNAWCWLDFVIVMVNNYFFLNNYTLGS